MKLILQYTSCVCHNISEFKMWPHRAWREYTASKFSGSFSLKYSLYSKTKDLLVSFMVYVLITKQVLKWQNKKVFFEKGSTSNWTRVVTNALI